MHRYGYVLSIYVQRYMLQWLAWRSFAITLVINQVIPPLIGLAVWRTAFPHDPHISSYFAVLLVVRLLTVSYENHTFSGRIWNGELSDDLLRPHPVFLQTLGENIALRIWHLIIAIPLLLGVGLLLPLQLSWISLFAAVPAILLAAALQYLFTYMLAMSAFWTGRAHAIVSIGSTVIYLLGGVAVPIEFLPIGLKELAIWLPCRSMIGFPSEAGAGMLSSSELAFGYFIQVIWVLLLTMIVHKVWMLGIRKYTAAGA
jgi:ABC-2 type transport system permease protein